VGIWSGGAWLAERLQADLGLRRCRRHVISSALHRDDFGERGMAGGADATEAAVRDRRRHIVLIDDVLYTGRTIRAVINELYDFGRPARVDAGGAGRPRRARAADRAGLRRRHHRAARRAALALARDDGRAPSLRLRERR
jgi:pyrimidine operon attenuation protein/uracil phosphoribosyltransferase